MATREEIDTGRNSANVSAGIKKFLMKTVIMALLMVAILVVSSGRLDWWMAWAYLGVTVTGQVIVTLGLLSKHPDLLAERSQRQEGSKDWDNVLVRIVAVFLPIMIWIVAGVDKRLGWTPPLPLALQLVALFAVALGYALTGWAMVSNRFFSAMVRIQTDRGHTVVSGGPYRYVRHPGYVGSIIFDLASPLALGSVWTFVPAGLAICLLVLRTAMEDRTLQRELTGYEDYAGKVRYRLLPGVW